MLEILDKSHEIKDVSDTKIIVNNGRIEFTHVQFAYGDNTPIFN